MTRTVAVLGAAAVVGGLLAVSALAPAPTPYAKCPDTGIRLGRPIANPSERARVVGTFSPTTIEVCWPGTPVAAR